MSNKTISINPSLFSINSSKTKKNREQKTKPIYKLYQKKRNIMKRNKKMK